MELFHHCTFHKTGVAKGVTLVNGMLLPEKFLIFNNAQTYPISNKEPNHVSKKTIISQVACQKFQNINTA